MYYNAKDRSYYVKLWADVQTGDVVYWTMKWEVIQFISHDVHTGIVSFTMGGSASIFEENASHFISVEHRNG
jgi:hypothetical protein